ncbi:MAG: hypothetical protein ABI995_12190 [Acidobacteriota bacterium]
MKKPILILAVAGLTFAQNPPPTPLGQYEVVRVFEVKQGDAGAIYSALSRVFSGVSINNKMLIVRGPDSVVAAIEDAIKKLDVAPPPSPEARPAPNVELTVYLLYGSAQEDASAKVPADLDATVRQLHATFSYKSYRVLDTEVLRGRDNTQTTTQGSLPGGQSTFRFYYTPRVGAGAAPRLVRMQQLVLSVRLVDKVTTLSNESSIQTDLDAREGQKTVIGKANVGGTDDAIFLVVTPRVVE